MPWQSLVPSLTLVSITQMFDPTGIANWSLTHVDWSEGKWHPKSYLAKEVTYGLLKKLRVRALPFYSWIILPLLSWNFSVKCFWCCLRRQSIDETFHVTSDEKVLLLYIIYLNVKLLLLFHTLVLCPPSILITKWYKNYAHCLQQSRYYFMFSGSTLRTI